MDIETLVSRLQCVAQGGYVTWDDRHDLLCEVLRQLTEQRRLKKAFALACRVFGGDEWRTVQCELLEKVDSEPICRVCGCTHDNACRGGCYWVEPDLCSRCMEMEADT